MDKYGVEQPDVRKEKTAADTQNCRRCGARLRSPDDNNVKICDKCGTRPYEVSYEDR